MTARALPVPMWTPELAIAARRIIFVLGAMALAWALLRIYNDPWGGDAYAYWLAWKRDPMYGELGEAHSYLYSPAFAQLLYPFTLLPWPVFYVGWVALSAAAVVLVVGPVWGGLAFALFYPAWQDAWVGNIHNLMALALVLGMRHPAAWSFLLLTKVTPGVGLLWLAVRREWRKLGIAIGVTVGIVAMSALIAPHLWVEWIESLMTAQPSEFSATNRPLGLRLGIAAVIVALAAWRNRPAAIPFAIYIALPAIWVSSFALLLTIPALLRREPEQRVDGVLLPRIGRRDGGRQRQG